MTNDRRHPNVLNRDEAKPYEVKSGKHQVHGRMLGEPSGSQQLGGTLYEIPPGGISFPFHYHCANEEATYVVSGTGTARLGETRVKVRAGDWITHPVGPGNAHQMINDGAEPLVYLCISTKHKAEVVGYPDSKKIGVSAGESFDKRWIRQIFREGPSLDYFEGEPEA